MADLLLSNQAKKQPAVSDDPKTGEHEITSSSRGEEHTGDVGVETQPLSDIQAGKAVSSQSQIASPVGQGHVEGQRSNQDIENPEEQGDQLGRQITHLTRSSSKKPRSILRRNTTSSKYSRKSKTVKLVLPKAFKEKLKLPTDFYRVTRTRHPRARSWSDSHVPRTDDKSERISLLSSQPPTTRDPLIRLNSTPGDFGISRENIFTAREEAEYFQNNPQANAQGQLQLPCENHEIETKGKGKGKEVAHCEKQRKNLRPGLLLDTTSPLRSEASVSTIPQISPRSPVSSWSSDPSPSSPTFQHDQRALAQLGTQPKPIASGLLKTHEKVAKAAKTPAPRQDSVVSLGSATRLGENRHAIQMTSLSTASRGAQQERGSVTTKVTEARSSGSSQKTERADNNESRSRHISEPAARQGSQHGNDGQMDQPGNQDDPNDQPENNQPENNQPKNNQPEVGKWHRRFDSFREKCLEFLSSCSCQLCKKPSREKKANSAGPSGNAPNSNPGSSSALPAAPPQLSLPNLNLNLNPNRPASLMVLNPRSAFTSVSELVAAPTPQNSPQLEEESAGDNGQLSLHLIPLQEWMSNWNLA
ncbi:hypothetical protein F4809DRAFT_437345 [Biscogniauxia mediterranea]|nr:hypothetical protein F4809DRAFT_437345 [Biscogniauxia mediterranea]